MQHFKKPYTLESFIAIAERDSKSGKNIAAIGPRTRAVVNDLQKLSQQYRNQQTTATKRSNAANRATYRKKHRELKASLHQALKSDVLKILMDFETHLNNPSGFSLNLKQANPIRSRQIYVLNRTDKSIYFPVQQAAKIIQDIGEIEPTNRNSIIRSLKESLNKKHEFCVYKFDIKNFFESIPHDKLLMKLKLQPDFDSITERIVTTLLNEYSSFTQKNFGLPQGVGLSSFLAEFYLKPFDSKIKSLPGVLYYARYVDDVIIVIENEHSLNIVERKVEKSLDSLQLELNPDKTKSLAITEASGTVDLEYLGYHFKIQLRHQLKTSLTQTRINRKNDQLEKAFADWHARLNYAKNRTSIDGLLIQRIRYLAGNTKLVNSKNNATIGLFFSNSSLDETSHSLRKLNSKLRSLIYKYKNSMTPTLESKLSNIDFEESFRNRTFYRFPAKKLRKITSIWK